MRMGIPTHTTPIRHHTRTTRRTDLAVAIRSV
jgi:hypothetical protein